MNLKSLSGRRFALPKLNVVSTEARIVKDRFKAGMKSFDV
jgi:hypothetical protein